MILPTGNYITTVHQRSHCPASASSTGKHLLSTVANTILWPAMVSGIAVAW